MFFSKKTYNELTKDAINILLRVKENNNDDSDFVWTSYDNVNEFYKDIDRYIIQLEKSDKEILDEIYNHFLPTATFQELAMANGWTIEYHKLAEKFDKIYYQMKNYY